MITKKELLEWGFVFLLPNRVAVRKTSKLNDNLKITGEVVYRVSRDQEDMDTKGNWGHFTKAISPETPQENYEFKTLAKALEMAKKHG